MAITENIVRMMNGSIEVTSRLGEGSQFTVTVQLELVNEEVTDTEELLDAAAYEAFCAQEG